MSLTQSHKRRVMQKIQDSHGHGSVEEVRHAEHDLDFVREFAVCLDHQVVEVAIVKLKKTITSQSKSVFDMSAAEFKDYVRPRAIELANDRWKKGLSLSLPAGKGYKANQFFHIYKNKSVQLVEVEEKTGAVKFIKQIS